MKAPKEIQKLKVALTTRCLLACRHCRVDKAAGLTIGWRDAARGVDLLLGSPGRFKRLELYGGEAFLEFALLKKINAYARRRAAALGKKLSVSVASNGLSLDAARLAWAKKAGLNLSISISGSPESHDGTRIYPGGRGSYSDLLKKLPAVFSALDRADVVALECVAPERAAALSGDLRRLAGLGFEVINIECVHGRPWSAAQLEALEAGLKAFGRWLTGRIAAGERVVPEPFLEFFRARGAAHGPECPLYRDLELYPDGTYSFYPFAFIDYPARRGQVRTGSSARGLDPRWSSCRPGGPLCPECGRAYYTVEGLGSGARAYALRTRLLKKLFLAVMRRSAASPAFKAYARRLAALAARTYAGPEGAA